MTDECREAWYKRYGHYPCRLSENAWSMFCAGWEEARRSPDARNDALEEAAKVCEREWKHSAASLIRALKDRRP